MVSLKLAVTIVPVLTPVAPSAGDTVDIVGRVLSIAAVVKLHVKSFASALWAKSFIPDAPPLSVAVYTVDAVNAATGLRVACFPEAVTVAAIDVLPAFS